MLDIYGKVRKSLGSFILSVPVRWKIIGIGILPVFILGVSLNYWITTGLSDWLSYILSDVRVNAAMEAGGRSVLFVTIIAAFLSIILLTLLVYILNRPLEELKATAQTVADGNYKKRAEVWAKDEIGDLAISVNQMIDNFVLIQRDLSLSNQQLQAINRIALAADQQEEIHDVLYVALESLQDLTNACMGWVYLYDPEVDRYHLASWKDVPEDLKATLIDVEAEPICECHRLIQEGVMHQDLRVVNCTKLLEFESLNKLSRHISIPIKARNIWFGVINLFQHTNEEMDPELMDLVASIGSQISESVAKAYFQIKLREKEIARQFLLESLVSAQEDERSRLARELHDQAGQTLTTLLIRLKTLEKKSAEQLIINELGEIQEIVSKTIDEIRDLSYSLRPPALEEFGLGTAIEALAEDMTKQIKTRAKCKYKILCPIPSELEVVIYRIVQEGLTNIIRHAKANNITIDIECKDQNFYMKIEDDGIGFNPASVTVHKGQRHLGLIGMNERTELIGGRFDMHSVLGKGTVIEVYVPIPQLEAFNEN